MGDRLGTLGAVGISFFLSLINIKDQIKKPECISLSTNAPWLRLCFQKKCQKKTSWVSWNFNKSTNLIQKNSILVRSPGLGIKKNVKKKLVGPRETLTNHKSRPKIFNTSQVPWDLDKIFTFRLCHTNLTWLRKDTSQAFGQVKNLANKKAELNRTKRKNSAFFHNP